MTSSPMNSQINNRGQTFHQWKNAIDSLFAHVFHNTSINLPDLAYYDMFIENVCENTVVLCMYRKINEYQRY